MKKHQTQKEKLEEKLDMKETETLIELLDKEDKTETKLKIITASTNRNEHKATVTQAEIQQMAAQKVARIGFWAGVIGAIVTALGIGGTLYREEIGAKVRSTFNINEEERDQKIITSKAHGKLKF